MDLIYKNYKIAYKDESYTLYLVNKEKETEKAIGYFTTIIGAMRKIYAISKGKKKELAGDKEILNYIKTLKSHKKNLDSLANKVNSFAKNLNKEINGY